MPPETSGRTDPSDPPALAAAPDRVIRRVMLTFEVTQDGPLTPFLEGVLGAILIGRPDLRRRVIEAEVARG